METLTDGWTDFDLRVDIVDATNGVGKMMHMPEPQGKRLAQPTAALARRGFSYAGSLTREPSGFQQQSNAYDMARFVALLRRPSSLKSLSRSLDIELGHNPKFVIPTRVQAQCYNPEPRQQATADMGCCAEHRDFGSTLGFCQTTYNMPSNRRNFKQYNMKVLTVINTILGYT